MSESKEPVNRLLQAFQDARRVLILTHNDPDPDALASAVALRHLLAELQGAACRIVYQGIVGRAENKALVRYLASPLQLLSASDWDWSDTVALVDTQPGAGNNSLAAGVLVTAVIDHHSWRDATDRARYVDVRPGLGATSTILTEYLRAAGLEPDPRLSTALFYGIKTDTRGLSRSAGPADAAAYLYLQPRVDARALAEIERAQVPPSYFKSFNATLRAARIYDGVIIAYVGMMDYPDLAAEMARLLLRLETAQWVICMGSHLDTVFLSVRSQGAGGGSEELVRTIVGRDGTAGGHGSMAGGQIALAGRNPEEVFRQSVERTLRHLGIPSGVPGEPLI